MNYIENDKLHDMVNLDYDSINDMNILKKHINIWRDEYKKLIFFYKRLKEYVENENKKNMIKNEQYIKIIDELKNKNEYYLEILNKIKNHKLTIKERINGKINIEKWMK